MKSVTSRTKFQVEMSHDGGTFRKIDPTGSWTTYPVAPMTLAQAEFVCYDHNSRGTCSKFTLVDVEFEAAQIAYARQAKEVVLFNKGYYALNREERLGAAEIRKAAIEAFGAAKRQFLADYILACYCV